jgi:hypothetical protein
MDEEAKLFKEQLQSREAMDAFEGFMNRKK